MAAPNPDKAVSNSFDYVPVRKLPDFILDRQNCSARDLGLAGVGSSRVVLVNVAGDRTVLCKTDTGDFDESEIRLVVHDRGQLYMDVSGKPSIDDFVTDVRQFVISHECRGCPDFEACCCCYIPAPRQFFDDDEAWVADLMRSLRGRVLDVGLGNVPYLRAGKSDVITEYHGVDPDLDVGASDIEGLKLHNIGIEDFFGFDGYFDTVLSLRSLNHFFDVPAALTSIYRCLKPGGRAVFVESLALPLVRTRNRAEQSHRTAAGGFQHLRNWDSSDLFNAVACIKGDRSGFKVDFHRPIGPETCDQWIVVLIKSAG